MQGNLIGCYEAPRFYIAIPFENGGEYIYDFIAYAGNKDEIPIRCGNKIITTPVFTVIEDFALYFRHLEDAIDWAYEHLKDIKLKIEEQAPGYFDWDKATIIKKEYIMIPLGKI